MDHDSVYEPPPITGPLAMPWSHWEEIGNSHWHRAIRMVRWVWHSFIQHSSGMRMRCADDVIEYYKQFVDLCAPLAEAGYLTEEEFNVSFWYGFHPDDQQELESRHLLNFPCLLDISFEEVFQITCSFFANPPTPQLQLQQSQSDAPKERHKPAILEPASAPLAMSTPPFPASHPPPGLCHPVVTSPLTQNFIDPGEGDLQLHVDLGSITSTQHSYHACKTSFPAPSPLRPASEESVVLPAFMPTLFDTYPPPPPSRSASAPPSLPARSSAHLLSPHNIFSSPSCPLPPSSHLQLPPNSSPIPSPLPPSPIHATMLPPLPMLEHAPVTPSPLCDELPPACSLPRRDSLSIPPPIQTCHHLVFPHSTSCTRHLVSCVRFCHRLPTHLYHSSCPSCRLCRLPMTHLCHLTTSLRLSFSTSRRRLALPIPHWLN
jgi:hypothetical protein